MKRYVIQSVFDDPDFGVIGDERSFRLKGTAVREWETMEYRRKRSKPSGWHYRVLDTKTNSVLRPTTGDSERDVDGVGHEAP